MFKCLPCRKKPKALQNAHLLCCAANRTAQCISIRVTSRDVQVIRLYASRFGFLRALHLNIQYQVRDKLLNSPTVPYY